MQVDFEQARWSADASGSWLCIPCGDPQKVIAWMEPGKVYTADIRKKIKKRSLDANAYFWELAGKLAAKLRISPDEVYRQYIPDIGDNYEIVPVKTEHIDHWARIWCAGHIGRQCDDLGPCKTPGYHNIRSYYSSSDFDTRQMGRLIDLVIADCKMQGIETLPPAELEGMMNQWQASGQTP